MLSGISENYLGRGGYDFVVENVRKIAAEHSAEGAAVAGLPVSDMYEKVRLLPYISEKRETLRTPADTLLEGGDCDDKTILMLAYAKCRKIQARIVLAGNKVDEYKHIFPEFNIGKMWVPMDATYDWCVPGGRMNCYHIFKIYPVV